MSATAHFPWPAHVCGEFMGQATDFADHYCNIPLGHTVPHKCNCGFQAASKQEATDAPR